MASISSTSNSLGNTALRGFGGLTSGIDRDSIIEQMTLGTQTKISNVKKNITSLGWKSEAFRSISDRILDLQDKYFSYTSSSNLKEPSFFAKNIISVLGDSKYTRFVSAKGQSDMINQLAVLGVKQTATAASRMSAYLTTMDGVAASGLTTENLEDANCATSLLNGRKLSFGINGTDGFSEKFTFTFPSSYKDENGKTVDIDYTTKDQNELIGKLNKALEQQTVKWGDNSYKMSELIQFESGTDGKFQIKAQDGMESKLGGSIYINRNSSAFSALGVNTEDEIIKGTDESKNKGISLSEFNGAVAKKFDESYVRRETIDQFMAGRKVSVSYGGTSKTIELLTKDEAKELADLKKPDGTPDGEAKQKKLQEFMNNHLKKVFGTTTDASGNTVNNVSAEINAKGEIEFRGADKKQTLKVTSSDPEMKKELGLDKTNSNKVSTDLSIRNNWEKLGFTGTAPAGKDELTMTINGTDIKFNADMTVNQLIEKINSSDAGVKASYLSSSNQFALVATETGKRGEISLEGEFAKAMFGGDTSKPDSGAVSNDGKNAEIRVSYGDGIEETIESMSNTINVAGLEVTVSGAFGYDDSGNYIGDKSQAVTFNAKANTEEVTKAVKEFIEAYNELIKEVNTQVTTKKNSSYGPLTDEQKDQMDETSIENWEKKAKEGLLFNDGTMRELSSDLQGMLNQILVSGIKYEDLEEMGITMSDDAKDGGILVFDETKFKQAMESEPEKVAEAFAGNGDGNTGMMAIMENTMTKYATRYAYKNGGSYGRLIEEAGSEKVPTSLSENQIYRQLQDMEENLLKLQATLKSEQDRYITQFTAMEKMISQMNSQSSYLSQLSV